jgi:hypothetical protein
MRRARSFSWFFGRDAYDLAILYGVFAFWGCEAWWWCPRCALGTASAHNAVGGGVVLVLSLVVDGVIFEGLLKGVVREGFAFLLRQERCLRRVVDGSGGL